MKSINMGQKFIIPRWITPRMKMSAESVLSFEVVQS